MTLIRLFAREKLLLAETGNTLNLHLFHTMLLLTQVEQNSVFTLAYIVSFIYHLSHVYSLTEACKSTVGLLSFMKIKSEKCLLSLQVGSQTTRLLQKCLSNIPNLISKNSAVFISKWCNKTYHEKYFRFLYPEWHLVLYNPSPTV